MYYLMIKEIEQTGLKYLCKRRKTKNPQDHINYVGSGKLWRRILNAHPEYTIKTTVLGLYDKTDLAKYGLYYSKMWNIVESKEWANLMPEVGDGGITHKNTHPYKNIKTGKIVFKKKCPKGYVPYANTQKPSRVIHNPITGQIRKINPSEPTPEGWQDGGIKGKFSYGPKKNQTKVYHNGRRKIYVKKGEPVPHGFVPGIHYEGTTKGRIGCHNPITKEKRYINPNDTLPDGFIRGLLPTTGKKLQTPFGIFDSVSKCMEYTKLTRHAIQSRIKNDSTWFYIKD
jgi:hypothetical protein